MSSRLRVVSEWIIFLKIFQTPTATNAVKNADAIVSCSYLLFIVMQEISKFSLVFPSKTIVLYVRNLPLYRSMDIDQIFFAYTCLCKCKSL